MQESFSIQQRITFTTTYLQFEVWQIENCHFIIIGNVAVSTKKTKKHTQNIRRKNEGMRVMGGREDARKGNHVPLNTLHTFDHEPSTQSK